MPRLADLKDQQLYRLDHGDTRLGSIFRGPVDVALIAEQWDPLVRIAASLRSRTTPAHVVLDRLASSSSDRLAKALTMLGRAVKTIHILRYAHDAQLRARIQKQLNRGGSRHALARRLFFANQGRRHRCAGMRPPCRARERVVGRAWRVRHRGAGRARPAIGVDRAARR